MSNLRQEIEQGTIVILDQDKNNSSEVLLIRQTPGKLFSTVASVDNPENTWEVMTVRLTKKK